MAHIPHPPLSIQPKSASPFFTSAHTRIPEPPGILVDKLCIVWLGEEAPQSPYGGSSEEERERREKGEEKSGEEGCENREKQQGCIQEQEMNAITKEIHADHIQQILDTEIGHNQANATTNVNGSRSENKSASEGHPEQPSIQIPLEIQRNTQYPDTHNRTKYSGRGNEMNTDDPRLTWPLLRAAAQCVWATLAQQCKTIEEPKTIVLVTTHPIQLTMAFLRNYNAPSLDKQLTRLKAALHWYRHHVNPVFLLIKSVWDGTNACGHSGRRILQDTTSTQSIGLVVCDRTVSMGALQCLLSQRVIGEMIIWPVEIQAGNKHWRHGQTIAQCSNFSHPDYTHGCPNSCVNTPSASTTKAPVNPLAASYAATLSPLVTSLMTQQPTIFKFKKCGRCKEIMYCSTECQKMDWPRHLRMCNLVITTRVRRRLNKTASSISLRPGPRQI